MRIAVDLLGGDHAPAVVVDGALLACSADPELHLLLVGPATVADEVLALLPADAGRRVDVRDVDGRSAWPTHRCGPCAPTPRVRASLGALAEGRADGMVSAGHTGAVVTAAVHAVGRLPGVRRPALAATLPTAVRPAGAPRRRRRHRRQRQGTWSQHAVLGAAYAHALHGIVAAPDRAAVHRRRAGQGRPGCDTRADAALAGVILPGGGRYFGPVEGYDVPLGGPADVVVTDGFVGNVLLKGIEGAYALAGPGEPPAAPPRGGPAWASPGTVVICHGTATGSDIASGIALAARLHRTGVPALISETVPLATAAVHVSVIA